MDENVYITMGALALSFSGNFINAIGLVYQKKGHMRIQNTQKKTSIALLTWRLNRDGHLVGMPPKIPRIGEKDLKNVKEESLIAEFMASNQRSFLSEPQWEFGFGDTCAKAPCLILSLGRYIFNGITNACGCAGLWTTGHDFSSSTSTW